MAVDYVDNKKLYAAMCVHIAAHRKAKEDGTELQDGWLKASQMIDYDQFEGMTKGFQPTGLINTSIEFPDFTDLESAWARLGDTLMEEMDKQVNAILRQPAVMVAYLNLRKSHSGIEQAKVAQAIKREIGDDGVTSSPSNDQPWHVGHFCLLGFLLPWLLSAWL